MIPKFRVWDIVKKAMSEVQAIVYTEEKVYTTYLKVTRRYIPFSYAVLMQSTGLFDKNGVEIFDGDVVKVFDKDLYVVEWSSQVASYKLIPVDRQWSDCYFSNYENITKIVEIVGNIWEDGELLDS